ncbi:hypothetical protein SAMN04487965_2596 [Microbulbifer donghaiensis]|uniref:Uncharacterized protein n=1 Tax=Microbulbifer donghaiensis TaxID=494016 RepID=A0A1M5E5I9_9GAMM|nr:hypothetical protein [Microbulbifer donghaiensis]SHF74503.1 hypothetical protein SAMN04487965_2596 [Microbulbifer donghaiensis]
MFADIFSKTRNLPRLIAELPPRVRQQLLAAAIWLVLAIFCSAALGHYYGQQKSMAMARDRDSAEAAAAFLASQSLESIVAGDRISMQLLTQQLLALPVISGVTVQDVESSILAQVGDAERGESVSAPVVLHDSIAGNVTIHLLPGSGVTFPWASLLLSLVFALPFSAAAALAATASLSQAGGAAARRAVPVVQARPAAPPKPEPEIAAGLYIRPLNWAQLGNQLSRSALDKLQLELEERLQLLQRIYDARPLKHAGPQQGLGFCGDDAAFRAVCCGLLLRELHSASRATGLQLALAVVPARLQSFDFSGEQLLAQSRGLSLHAALLDDKALDGRVEHHGTSWGAEVTGLVPTYQKLLDNQLHQLLNA